MAAIFEKLSLSTTELESSCLKWGMKLNALKCKNKITSKLTEKRMWKRYKSSLSWVQLSLVLHLMYLGGKVLEFLLLGDSSQNSGQTRTFLLKSVCTAHWIIPIAIYATETWTLPVRKMKKGFLHSK